MVQPKKGVFRRRNPPLPCREDGSVPAGRAPGQDCLHGVAVLPGAEASAPRGNLTCPLSARPLRRFIRKPNICQDRLGANTLQGKHSNSKTAVFLSTRSEASVQFLGRRTTFLGRTMSTRRRTPTLLTVTSPRRNACEYSTYSHTVPMSNTYINSCIQLYIIAIHTVHTVHTVPMSNYIN